MFGYLFFFDNVFALLIHRFSKNTFEGKFLCILKTEAINITDKQML